MADCNTHAMTRIFLSVLIAASVCLSPLPLHAAEKGWFGFALSIDAEGISLNPKLRSIKIEKVFPNSPAAAAGLAPGDNILEMEGIVVAGAHANALKTATQKSVGETLRLKFQRGAEAPRDLSLVAAAKPPS
jgi:S1-C subfamily serine protease